MLDSPLRLHFLSVLLLCCVSPSSFVVIRNPVVDLVACRPRQIEAFTQFKNEFDTRRCNHSNTYNGVWCDNSTGVVTKLQLRACLSGILKPNSTLFRFRQLRHLDLSHNDFTSSSLPSEIGNLNKLEAFPIMSSLVVFLVRNLTKLNGLELENNHFSGTIPSSLLTLPFLAIINLRENHLTGSIEASNSSTSSWLEFLYLRNNHFEGEILEPISKFTSLKDLDLSFQNISYPIDLTLFSSLKSLLILDLSGNSILPASLNISYSAKLYQHLVCTGE
ncbi:unnamed protein product [Thlaspi arvense]|uniref:Leucine-rich repeat-containing N-terminal plant-type domain-containing protein n=1 Tax=Thlaspi arvense TaxID=13288 RepID=A0AAU9SC85_THLAR|nr:unnamed protein product [Thlaspi arvense]